MFPPGTWDFSLLATITSPINLFHAYLAACFILNYFGNILTSFMMDSLLLEIFGFFFMTIFLEIKKSYQRYVDQALTR